MPSSTNSACLKPAPRNHATAFLDTRLVRQMSRKECDCGKERERGQPRSLTRLLDETAYFVGRGKYDRCAIALHAGTDDDRLARERPRFA